jgi:hypothetical protein
VVSIVFCFGWTNGNEDVGVDIVNSCDQFEIATLKWKMNVDAIDSSGHPPWPIMAWPTKTNGKQCMRTICS